MSLCSSLWLMKIHGNNSYLTLEINRLNAVFCDLVKGLGEANNWSRKELFL